MDKLNGFLQLALTIDKTFYANNPLHYHTTRPELANKELFCHLSLGTTSLSAVDIFGRSELDATGVVQLLAQNLVTRLYYIYQLKAGGTELGSSEKRNYLSGLKVLGLCL